MWDGEVCVKFLYEFLSVCFAAKRRELGLNREEHRGMTICDRASCHLHRTFLALRKVWGEKENVLMYGSDPDSEVQVPAKIGAVGSPNDAYHQFIHMVRRFRERTCWVADCSFSEDFCWLL